MFFLWPRGNFWVFLTGDGVYYLIQTKWLVLLCACSLKGAKCPNSTLILIKTWKKQFLRKSDLKFLRPGVKLVHSNYKIKICYAKIYKTDILTFSLRRNSWLCFYPKLLEKKNQISVMNSFLPDTHLKFSISIPNKNLNNKISPTNYYLFSKLCTITIFCE